MDKILEVKNLKISFRTQAGTLKAVRDISFDLERGTTLAIVGESGSGKSVTAKAMLGILAGNTIIEGGEIFYDGKDLLKISEDDFHHIRGDKIAMIFQDPLSSLNPIVKIGKQITEATMLKNKSNRREAKAEFNHLLSTLKSNVIASGKEDAAAVNAMFRTFDKFCIESNHLENEYNLAHGKVEDLRDSVEDVLFKISKQQKLDVKLQLREYRGTLKSINRNFLCRDFHEEVSAVYAELGKTARAYKSNSEDLSAVSAALEKLAALLKKIESQTRPDFFSIGYYKLFYPNADLNQPIEKLNEEAGKYLRESFMEKFEELARAGVEYSYESARKNKAALLPALREARAYYAGTFEKADALKRCSELSALVEGSIDHLEFIKDSSAYTFRSALTGAINRYFYCMKNNPKEEARFARQSRKRDRLIARGKTVTWKVVPKVVYSPEELKGNILKVIDRLTEHYEAVLQQSVDIPDRTDKLIAHFREQASLAVYRVTKAMAKEMAIKLMDEVGIHEPRLRYNQYPFEFSGGMRQRIVIAIALAANPDILICDEPTTALDVTIQAQILELINKLKKERNLSILFITHDLGVVANMADNIAVMYAGKIVEFGTADEIFYDPRHPYTWALLSSMPDLDTKEKLDAIPGTPPNMIYPPQGDAFAARNKYAMQIDFEEHPPFFYVSDTHAAATWLLHPDAPKVEIPKAITDRIARMNAKRTGGQKNA